MTIWANEKLKKIAKKKGGSSLSHHLISKACAGLRDLLMRQPGVAFLVLLFLPLLLVNDGYAQGVLVGPDGKTSTQVLSLPYGFYNENFGFAAGYVYGVTGYPQEQSALLTTAIVGSRGSGMLFLLGRDIRMPGTRRLFFDPVASVGYFGENEAYIDGNPKFRNERAGSNDSDEKNFVEGKGWDNFFRLRFKYVLPIGTGKDQVISTFRVDRGLLTSGASGGNCWNPLVSGKTYLELRPFYRWQQIDGDDVDADLKTNGADVSVFWDNRDFFANPSKGFGLRGKASRDFGWFDSSDSWTSVEGELDAYIPLGYTDWFRQRVIALDVWSSYSPTWDEGRDGTIANRPPAYTGATLGGLWRMRGFPSQRFNDRAAVYYSAELRLMPKWNPFDGWPRIQKYLGIQWLQFVPFVEVGRVAPEWDVNRLHSDMKWDAGIGIRAWAQGIVARIDTAYSDEGFGVQMMISQPFQF